MFNYMKKIVIMLFQLLSQIVTILSVIISIIVNTN